MTVVSLPVRLLPKQRLGLDLARDGRTAFGWTVEYLANRHAGAHFGPRRGDWPRPRAVVLAGVPAAVLAQPDPDGPAVVVRGYTEYLNRLGFVPKGAL